MEDDSLRSDPATLARALVHHAISGPSRVRDLPRVKTHVRWHRGKASSNCSEGRLRINSLNAAPLREILERWIGKYEAYWSNTLLRVKESAESATAKKKSKRKRA